jgi:ATP-binding cassette, subfamily B, bacterial
MSNKYRMIWGLMSGRRRLYGCAVGALVLASCFLYLVPLIPQVLLDGVLAKEPERASPFVQRAVVLGGGREYLRAHLWLPALVVALLSALAGALTYLRGRWSALASEAIARKLRDRLFDQLQHLPCSYHDKAKTGDQVQRCTSDVETFRQFLASQVVEIGRAVFMMAVPIPLMLALDARMTAIALVSIPPVVLFSVIFFRRVRASFQQVDEAEGRMSATLQENLTGVRVVRAFARQSFEEEKFDQQNSVHRDLDNRLYKLMAWYWSSSDLMCMGQKALVVAVGGYWLAQGRLQVGAFFFFLTAVSMFIWPIRMMGRILTELGKATVAIGRIAEILEHPRESGATASILDDEETLPNRPAPLLAVIRSDASAYLAFDRVSFSRADGSKVLDDVSFELRAGGTLALLGPSGSGKSTIINLLLRFYDPDSGRILLGGRDLRSLTRQEARAACAVVMQEPFLYSKTVRENIRLGQRGARESEIEEAAVTACLHETIHELERGYDTLVGERGVTLSGGQRQRVALARALLDRPGLLILDDALSAVDAETEARILQALQRVRGRQTTLVVSHRLSTLCLADRILVMDRGRVTQTGTHADLVKADGFYRRLWRIQHALEDNYRQEEREVAPAP